VVTILALAAAALYGTADFLGGVASRRASVFTVLALTVPAGAVVMVVVALLGEAPGLGGLLGTGGVGTAASAGGWSAAAWAAGSGVCGAFGLVAFYAGFATAPISVVAPVAALVSAVLPVGVAIVQGERPGAGVIAGGLVCLVAIVLVSAQHAQQGTHLEGEKGEESRGGGQMVASGRLLALGYGVAAGAGFGLFFIFLKNAGQSGVLWPVAISRLAGTVVAFGIALVTRTRLWPRRGAGVAGIALVSGAIDAAANVCYVLATRAGLFGLAVVITSLYPGVTVLLARFLLGERMRWLQRAGLLLAAVGVVLVTVLPRLTVLVRVLAGVPGRHDQVRDELAQHGLQLVHDGLQPVQLMLGGALGASRGPGTVILVCFLEDQPAHLEIQLFGVREVIHVAQCLVLPGRLHDELAVPEYLAHRRPVEAHVGHLGQRHHVRPAVREALNQQQPLRRDDEVVKEPLDDLPHQPQQEDPPQEPDHHDGGGVAVGHRAAQPAGDGQPDESQENRPD
jgi:drug/metabolite transporter (DMT)-like permease